MTPNLKFEGLLVALHKPIARIAAMMKQRTLKSLVRTVGIGLHSGTKVELILRPAAANTGIVFRRVDLEPPVDIAANPLMVGDTRMASTLDKDGVRIATIEHLMSALAGLGIALKSTWDVYRQLQDGSLIALLPGYTFHSDVAIYAVYPHRRFLPAKTRVFIDFLTGRFGPQPAWDRF